jgi:hypothetical protein
MYQKAKIVLQETAKMAKSQFPTDKPAIRQIINDSADDICRNYYNLTDYEQNLLHNYACTLHPKN